jgi:hypothetical protein
MRKRHVLLFSSLIVITLATFVRVSYDKLKWGALLVGRSRRAMAPVRWCRSAPMGGFAHVVLNVVFS